MYLYMDPYKQMKLLQKKILRKHSKSWVSFPNANIWTKSHVILFPTLRHSAHYHRAQAQKNLFSVNQEV